MKLHSYYYNIMGFYLLQIKNIKISNQLSQLNQIIYMPTAPYFSEHSKQWYESDPP